MGWKTKTDGCWRKQRGSAGTPASPSTKPLFEEPVLPSTSLGAEVETEQFSEFYRQAKQNGNCSSSAVCAGELCRARATAKATRRQPGSPASPFRAGQVSCRGRGGLLTSPFATRPHSSRTGSLNACLREKSSGLFFSPSSSAQPPPRARVLFRMLQTHPEGLGEQAVERED